MTSREEILFGYVHSPECSQYAMQKLSDAGVDVGLHRMICGSMAPLVENKPFAIYSLIFAMSLRKKGQLPLCSKGKTDLLMISQDVVFFFADFD
jgi:hypothetical protein